MASNWPFLLHWRRRRLRRFLHDQFGEPAEHGCRHKKCQVVAWVALVSVSESAGRPGTPPDQHADDRCEGRLFRWPRPRLLTDAPPSAAVRAWPTPQAVRNDPFPPPILHDQHNCQLAMQEAVFSPERDCSTSRRRPRWWSSVPSPNIETNHSAPDESASEINAPSPLKSTRATQESGERNLSARWSVVDLSGWPVVQRELRMGQASPSTPPSIHDIGGQVSAPQLSCGRPFFDVYPVVPCELRQPVIGHSAITLTLNTYAHVMDATLRAAAERMDDALGSDAGEEGDDGAAGVPAAV